jgi:hypothetical protein
MTRTELEQIERALADAIPPLRHMLERAIPPGLPIDQIEKVKVGIPYQRLQSRVTQLDEALALIRTALARTDDGPRLGHVDYDEHCRETARLEAEMKLAWDAGAEKMREACALDLERVNLHGDAEVIRALPLPRKVRP